MGDLTAAEHYERAEYLVKLALGDFPANPIAADVVALAQVHATLALAGVAAGPQATPGQEPVCGGFVWIGQPMTSCDRCGQPAWEHEGLDQPPADPFSDAPSTVRPWKPGEAEAIRAKWGGSSTVHVAEVRRPIPGARDMTGNAVPTDHEDRP